MKILVISHPVVRGYSGGARREFFVIRELLNWLKVDLYFPFRSIIEIFFISQNNRKIIKYALESLKRLENKGLGIPQYYFYLLENEKLIESLERVILRKKLSYVLNLQNVKKFEKHLIDKLVEKRELNIRDIKMIYSPHENFEFIFSALLFSQKTNKKVSILLQETPYFRIRHFYRFFVHNPYSSILMNYYGLENKKYILDLIRKNRIHKILAISIAPVILSGINKYYRAYILKIGNAFDRKLLKYRTFRKKDHLVFFARLTPEKGIFEIPYIVNEVRKKIEDIKLYVIGSFNKISNKIKFLNLVKKFKLEDNIIVTGFLDDKKLYRLVSKAKALVYPSHQDAFPLVILESLALGTSVVAYDIPAIKYVYRNLKPVRIVREGNIREMSNKIIKILNQSSREYRYEHENGIVKNFLRIRSSWKNVAKEELEALELKI